MYKTVHTVCIIGFALRGPPLPSPSSEEVLLLGLMYGREGGRERGREGKEEGEREGEGRKERGRGMRGGE